jgi:hypothetical protein
MSGQERKKFILDLIEARAAGLAVLAGDLGDLRQQAEEVA